MIQLISSVLKSNFQSLVKLKWASSAVFEALAYSFPSRSVWQTNHRFQNHIFEICSILNEKAVQFLRLAADSRSVWQKLDPVNFISIKINFSKFGQVQMSKWCSFLGQIGRLIFFKISVIDKSLFSNSNL